MKLPIGAQRQSAAKMIEEHGGEKDESLRSYLIARLHAAVEHMYMRHQDAFGLWEEL
jgi:hypothetical protein